MKLEKEIKAALATKGLIQDDLIAYGMTKPSIWAGILGGAIGAAIASSNTGQFAFTVVDGVLIKTQLKGWGKEIFNDSAVGIKKESLKDFSFKKVLGGGQLVIKDKDNGKQVYNIMKPIDSMYTIVAKFWK